MCQLQCNLSSTPQHSPKLSTPLLLSVQACMHICMSQYSSTTLARPRVPRSNCQCQCIWHADLVQEQATSGRFTANLCVGAAKNLAESALSGLTKILKCSAVQTLQQLPIKSIHPKLMNKLFKVCISRQVIWKHMQAVSSSESAVVSQRFVM